MILVVFGTRPEFIKVSPIIKELGRRKIEHKVVNTGQHREMLEPLLKWFGIKADYNLDIMKPNQSLNGIVASAIPLLNEIYRKECASIVVVQGDTTTAFVAAYAAFNNKIKVAHVEAGLRTGNLYNPFPEEANRRLISQIASLHFTPTALNSKNLLDSGIKEDVVFETGNTVIDSLFQTIERLERESYLPPDLLKRLDEFERVITVTGHRRENIGKGFEEIFTAIRDVALSNNNVVFVYPVHLNPLVKSVAEEILKGIENVILTMPLDYPAFVELMSKSYLIVSDSGGIQEEAPSLNIPVLVTRTTTERMEAVNTGAVLLVGINKEKIARKIRELLLNAHEYEMMSNAKNPYGSGEAAITIVNILENYA